MLLVRVRPIISPKQAERLVANLWQLAIGSSLALHVVQLGHCDGPPPLGVATPNPALERDAADLVAAGTRGEVQEAGIVPDLVCAAPRVAAFHLQPAARRLRSNSESWGWDRADNLLHLYDLLTRTRPGTMAGAALVFVPLQDMQGAAVLTAYAAGPVSGLAYPAGEPVLRLAYRVAATYAGTGVRVRRPLMQRRWLRRCMSGQVSLGLAPFRGHGIIRVEEMSAFWHPPLAISSPAQPSP
jgi:hypothetical protein